MARCYLTGVDVPLEESYVLDLTAAHRALRELKEKVATLERLIAQLGPTDAVSIPNRAGGGVFLRKDRRVVSRSMAAALGAVSPDRDLFLPWAQWRGRARILPLTILQHHADYGPRIRELSADETEQVVVLARQVLHRLAPGQALPPDVRTATMAGVCVALRERTAEEVVTLVRHRLTSEEPLQDLGVPPQVEAEFRAALGFRQPEAWGVTPGGAPLDSVEGKVETDQETE